MVAVEAVVVAAEVAVVAVEVVVVVALGGHLKRSSQGLDNPCKCLLNAF